MTKLNTGTAVTLSSEEMVAGAGPPPMPVPAVIVDAAPACTITAVLTPLVTDPETGLTVKVPDPTCVYLNVPGKV